MHTNDFHPPEVILDGKFHRFGRNGGKDNAFYLGYLNRSPRPGGQDFVVALVGDWRQPSEGWLWHKPEAGRGWSAEDRAVADAQMKRMQDELAEQRRQQQIRAAAKAEKAYTRAYPDGRTAYLERKQVPELYGARIESWRSGDAEERKVLVPIRDVDGNWLGGQRIADDGKKRFFAGQRVEGGMFIIGELDAETTEVLLCEGYSTGASLRQATALTVVCAFNAANLVPVALALKARYPGLVVTVCGDDDRFIPDDKGGNVGAVKARKAALAAQAAVVLPRFASDDGEPTDFNDLHLREGLGAVRAQVLEDDLTPSESGFIPLGFDENTHFFFHAQRKDVVKLASLSGGGSLMHLAPLEYWELAYKTPKGGANWMAAQNAVIKASNSVGPFDASRVRGTGVWLDDGRVVVNTGASLIVDGKPLPLTWLKTWRVYVQSKFRMGALHDRPLSAAEGAQLFEACEPFRWSEPQAAHLLAGWLAVARIAGALPVRPHLWLTGGKGTGKSTVMEQLVNHALGGARSKLYLQGGSTEAGIRQAIKSSSLPLIFDEFEANDTDSLKRQQACMELARNAWSTTSGAMFKGSAGGYAVEYQLAFAALFSSIRVNFSNDADRSRFCVLELRPHGSDAVRWHDIQRRMRAINAEYGERLFARMAGMVPTVLASAQILEAEVSKTGRGQRLGQQLGTLFAGYWCLTHDEPPSQAEAAALAGDIQLEDESVDAQMNDEDECYLHLLSWRIPSGVGTNMMPVGDAIYDAENRYASALKGFGIKVENGTVKVANSYSELAKIYKGTRWSMCWHRSLLRLPGAKPTNGLRFGDGKLYRCTSIPVGNVPAPPGI